MSYRRHVTHNHAKVLDDPVTERFNDTDNDQSDLGKPQVELEGIEAVCNEQHLQRNGDPATSHTIIREVERHLPESTLNEIAKRFTLLP